MGDTKLLLKYHKDPNQVITDYGTTFFLAVCNLTTEPEAISYLINRGADIHKADIYGRNCFCYAMLNKHPNMDIKLTLLLKDKFDKELKRNPRK